MGVGEQGSGTRWEVGQIERKLGCLFVRLSSRGSVKGKNKLSTKILQ